MLQVELPPTEPAAVDVCGSGCAGSSADIRQPGAQRCRLCRPCSRRASQQAIPQWARQEKGRGEKNPYVQYSWRYAWHTRGWYWKNVDQIWTHLRSPGLGYDELDIFAGTTSP